MKMKIKKRIDSAELLADMAHKNGLHAADAAKISRLLLAAKLSPELLTPSVIHHADSINRTRTGTMVDKFNRDGFGPCVLVPPTENIRIVAERCRQKIAGLPLLSFLRWAGSQDWEDKTIRCMLTAAGVDCPAWLLEQQTNYGREQIGVPVSDEDQEGELYELFGECC